MSAMSSEYKAEKVASVSHLGGGFIWEVNWVLLVVPGAVMLWSMLQLKQSFFKPYTLPAAIADFMLHCVAVLFSLTIYSSTPQILCGLMILPTVAAFLQPSVKKNEPAKPPAKTAGLDKPADGEDAAPESDLDPLPVKPFITAYRGTLIILTCICILAVDFPVFPRRFAKTESFGTSVMDMGVGSFVFAAGIVAARQQLKEQITGTPNFVERFKTAMRHSLPLLVLGLIRLWSVKGLEYAEHVSEYGVHWNFFFTLALLSPVIAIIQPVLNIVPSYGIFAFVMAICYELVLFLPDGMKVYIILSERYPGDWMSQNREGVFSFAGYLSIFIAGMGIGMGILPRDPDLAAEAAANKDILDEDEEWLVSVLGNPTETDENGQPKEKDILPLPANPLRPELPKTTFFHLLKWSVLWFIFAVWAMWRYGPNLYVSRRMANLAYVVWVCCFNTFQLFTFYCIERLAFPGVANAKDKKTEKERVKDATSPVLHAFNRNALAIFLLANLLTGGINMSIQTWYMDDVQAMVVLVGYMAVVCGTALALDRFDISIKL